MIGEAVVNLALALGPLFGGVHSVARGFIVASVVPFALSLLFSMAHLSFCQTYAAKRRTPMKRRKTGEHFGPLGALPSLEPHVHSNPFFLLHASTVPITEVWSCTINCQSTHNIFSPIIDLLIDKFMGPCEIIIASSISLPLVYIFVGPLPLPFLVTPSKIQVIILRAFLGLAVAIQCIAALPVMFQVYK